MVDRWEQVSRGKVPAREKMTGRKIRFLKNCPRLPSLLFANDIYKRAKKANVSDGIALDWNKVEAESQNLNEEKAGRALFEIGCLVPANRFGPGILFAKFCLQSNEYFGKANLGRF